MSHHGREDERAECTVDWHEANLNRYGSAVELIKAIANRGASPKRDGGPAPHVLCDRWLEAHGFDCDASRKRQREQRAIELDAEIERLRAERAKL